MSDFTVVFFRGMDAIQSNIPQLTIISGGQTGADRAALDFAIAENLPHGGWCPKGRKAEDGKIDARYKLNETPSGNYLQRTEWNVRDTDATVLFTIGKELTGGSKRTAAFATKHGRPLLHLSKTGAIGAAQELRRFLAVNSLSKLNVAGNRKSKEPEVGAFVFVTLRDAFINLPDSTH